MRHDVKAKLSEVKEDRSILMQEARFPHNHHPESKLTRAKTTPILFRPKLRVEPFLFCHYFRARVCVESNSC